MNVKFKNGAELYLRSAFHSADASRGLSADLLLVDEVQDVAAGRLPVLAEVMSHARGGRMILTGTPKLIDNHLESYFNQSTANYWTMICDACSNLVTIDERALGPTSLICPSCQQPVNPALARGCLAIRWPLGETALRSPIRWFPGSIIRMCWSDSARMTSYPFGMRCSAYRRRSVSTS